MNIFKVKMLTVIMMFNQNMQSVFAVNINLREQRQRLLDTNDEPNLKVFDEFTEA